MNVLTHYLEQIVEPTFEDFKRNPGSERHAFLACVVTFHAIDRVSEATGISRGNLRKEWGKMVEFKVIDMVAHHLKHVLSDDERHAPRDGRLTLPDMVFRRAAIGTDVLGTRPAAGDVRLDIRHLYFAVRDVIKFLHQQAGELSKSAPPARRRRSRGH